MSAISSDALRGKKPITSDIINKLRIEGGHSKIVESIQSREEFHGDVPSASVAVHLTPDGRCGQAELVTLGGPLTGSIRASKVWPDASDDLELTISFEDLASVRWSRNLMHSNWMDSRDSKLSYHWSEHSNNQEDVETLDDVETETDIHCAGWSVRLQMRPKTDSELRIDILLVPVKLEEFTEDKFQNLDHARYPSFRVGKKGGESIKLLNLETGPEFCGIGTWPFLVDNRSNPTSFPESRDIKLAVSCLMRAAQDPTIKEKRDTWNSVSTTHTATAKKAAITWPRPPREGSRQATPAAPAGPGPNFNSTISVGDGSNDSSNETNNTDALINDLRNELGPFDEAQQLTQGDRDQLVHTQDNTATNSQDNDPSGSNPPIGSNPPWPPGSAGAMGLNWTLKTRPDYLTDQIFKSLPFTQAVDIQSRYETTELEREKILAANQSRSNKSTFKPDDEIPHILVSGKDNGKDLAQNRLKLRGLATCPTKAEIWRCVPVFHPQKRRRLPLAHILGSAERIHEETIEKMHHRGSKLDHAYFLSKNASGKRTKLSRAHAEIVGDGQIDLGFQNGWENASSVRELKQGISNLIALQRLIHPLDYSGLVISNVFGRLKDFTWCANPIKCGTEIFDHLLEVNATRATELEPPLTFDEAMKEAATILGRNGEDDKPPAEGSMTSKTVETKLKSLTKELDVLKKRKEAPRPNPSQPGAAKTYGDYKKQRLDLVDNKDGVAICSYFNTSKCNSGVDPGKKCKKGSKEFWHVCAAKANKNDPSSGACGGKHTAREHK